MNTTQIPETFTGENPCTGKPFTPYERGWEDGIKRGILIGMDLPWREIYAIERGDKPYPKTPLHVDYDKPVRKNIEQNVFDAMLEDEPDEEDKRIDDMLRRIKL